MNCRNCKNSSLKKIIYLGKQPLSGIFLKTPKKKLKKYSLDLFICKKCKLIQLGKSASSVKMFGKNYGYQSSISLIMKEHLKNICKKLYKEKIIDDKSAVLDIGSNDGTFLNFLKKTNKLYGIDPTIKKFKHYYNPNIKKINNFFSLKNIKNYFKNSKLKKFDLITSLAMFYDINNPNKFCQDIHNLLKDEGVWLVEFSYFPLLLKNLTYDQICHEHVTYYTLRTFKQIIEKNNFRIIEVSLNEINGGSIQVLLKKSNAKREILSKQSIKSILSDESKIGVYAYNNFNKRINKLKVKINKFLENKKNVCGYGASTKGNIVLNHCGINFKQLSYIFDSNKYKFNRFTPGSNIKIISKKFIKILKPKYLFVLIWSFRKEVIKEQISFIKQGGNLVFHLPKFHIINKKNYKKFYKLSFNKLSYSY